MHFTRAARGRGLLSEFASCTPVGPWWQRCSSQRTAWVIFTMAVPMPQQHTSQQRCFRFCMPGTDEPVSELASATCSWHTPTCSIPLPAVLVKLPDLCCNTHTNLLAMLVKLPHLCCNTHQSAGHTGQRSTACSPLRRNNARRGMQHNCDRLGSRHEHSV